MVGELSTVVGEYCGWRIEHCGWRILYPCSSRGFSEVKSFAVIWLLIVRVIMTPDSLLFFLPSFFSFEPAQPDDPLPQYPAIIQALASKQWTCRWWAS